MEAKTLGDTLSDVHALVESLADTVAEVKAETPGDTRGDAQALVNTLADTLAEVETETVGDTRGDAQALVDTMADSLAEGGGRDARLQTERCAGIGQDAGLHDSREAA